MALLKVCGSPHASLPDVWVICCSGCQGEGQSYLLLRSQQSTTKSVQELVGGVGGGAHSQALGCGSALLLCCHLALPMPPPPPPWGWPLRAPARAPHRSGRCLTNQTWLCTCLPLPSIPLGVSTNPTPVWWHPHSTATCWVTTGHILQAIPRELGTAVYPKANMLNYWPSWRSWGKRLDPHMCRAWEPWRD